MDARDCLHAVEELSDEAMVAARSRLNPAAGAMLSALWVAGTGQLAVIVHHLAVDAVSWRILLEDLNIAWAQHNSGQPVALPAARDIVPALGVAAQRTRAAARTSSGHADAWKRVAETPDAALPAVQPAVDTFATAGHLSVQLDAETTGMLLGEVPAAFHAGIHDILLIAFALAVAEFVGDRRARRSPSTSRATAATKSSAATSTCPAPSAGSPPNTRWPLDWVGVSWAQVTAGDAALGRAIKDAKEQLRALPDALDLRAAALPEHRCRALPHPIRRSDSTTLGAKAVRTELSEELWRIGEGWSATGAAIGDTHAADAHRWNSTPPPSTPTPARVCTPTGPGRPRRSTTRRSTG